MSTENVSEYVTLVSNDGYEFKLLRSAACIAGTIKRALNPESGFQETTRNRMDFPTIKYATYSSLELIRDRGRAFEQS
ncbi:hypothetical protein G6514_006119 [Epicoccum nigrum]|nr:hypothetical protein G6514_006119 [Epicoccum nigrum]